MFHQMRIFFSQQRVSDTVRNILLSSANNILEWSGPSLGCSEIWVMCRFWLMFGLIHTKRQMNTSLCLQASETHRGKHITADTAVLLSDLAYQQGTWHRFYMHKCAYVRKNENASQPIYSIVYHAVASFSMHCDIITSLDLSFSSNLFWVQIH